MRKLPSAKPSGLEWWEPKEGFLPTDFCLDSSLHGLKFIGQPKRHIFERIFWCVAFLASVSIATYSILQIWQKFKDTPVITIFQPEETLISSIPFPAITICNSNSAIKMKAQLLASQVYESEENAEAFNHLYLLRHLCDTQKTFAQHFNFSLESRGLNSTIREKVKQFRRKNKLTSMTGTSEQSEGSFLDFMNSVSQKCSDMILLCMWNDEIRNCSDLFVETETDLGYCCTFNMIPTSLLLSLRNDVRDKKEVIDVWNASDLTMDKLVRPHDEDESGQQPFQEKPVEFPRRQYRPGKSSGLSILLDPDMESYFCTSTDSSGFMALAHNTLDFPRVADNGLAIKPNSEVYMKILPEVTLADNEVENFPLEKRNCYFGAEYSLKYFNIYTSSNCEEECIANLTLKTCGCVQYFMPRSETEKLCGAKRHACTEAVRKTILQKGIHKECKFCLPTCTEIIYHSSVSYMPMREDVPLWEYPNGTNASWVHKKVSILHVHFKVDSVYAKLRTELYGILDLISNTGGLLGLCLGFSMLSLLEIIYFVTLRACCQRRRRHRHNNDRAEYMKTLNRWKFRGPVETEGSAHSLHFNNNLRMGQNNYFQVAPLKNISAREFYNETYRELLKSKAY